MLIALMSESLTKVTSQEANHSVREHLQLIVENQSLFRRETLFRGQKYLIIV